jgi:hypothetical protein
VTSISSVSGDERKVSVVPHAGQNPRSRPAKAISRGSPLMKRKSSRGNEHQVTKAAPALLRQSAQWQCVT